MSGNLRIALLLAMVIYFVCIVILLKKEKLELKYTLLWIFGGVLMLILVVFPEIIFIFAKITGIVDEVNGLLAVAIFLLIIILISVTSIISKLHSDLRSITQKCAIYEKRIRDIEEKESSDTYKK